MADLDTAVQFVLHQEDARLSGAITTLPGDRGGATRYGLAARWHPELVEEGYYEMKDGEPTVPNEYALAIAVQVYSVQYASKLNIPGIADQDLANRALSFAVNEGPHEAVTLLQRAANACGCRIAVDGDFGPETLKAVDGLQPERLLAAFRSVQAGFYRRLVAVRPQLLPYLNGFLNRANV